MLLSLFIIYIHRILFLHHLMSFKDALKDDVMICLCYQKLWIKYRKQQFFYFNCCGFYLSGDSFAEPTDDSGSQELECQPAQLLSVLHWGKTITFFSHVVSKLCVVHADFWHLFSFSWFKRWWSSSIVSGWIFAVLQSWSHSSFPLHQTLPPPRHHGGVAQQRLCSESVWCCCTGCCCITAASQRAAGRCCTCMTRWFLRCETRWEESLSWARAKVHTHTNMQNVAEVTEVLPREFLEKSSDQHFSQVTHFLEVDRYNCWQFFFSSVLNC